MTHKRLISGIILAAGVSLFLFFGLSAFSHFYIFHQTFEDFTMELFRNEVTDSTLNLHYTLSDPSVYGIKENAVSYGNLNKKSWEEEQSYLLDCQQRLKDFQKQGLKESEELTAQILDWWLKGQIESEKYYYLQEPLSPTLGVQAQLSVLLAEFPFRRQKDIDIYLELISQLPEYMGQIADFEKEKAQLGLFLNDEILDKILAQCNALLHADDSHVLIASFDERIENCSFLNQDQIISYEAKNQNFINKYFIPAYQNLCADLELLRGSGINKGGLYYFSDGIAYYEYLLKYSVGTNLSTAVIHQRLEEQMEEDYETILYAVHQDVNIEVISHSSLAADSPEQILENLQQQICQDFPKAPAVSYQVKEVPHSLSNYLSPAFYMTPAIDAPQQNTIYINPAYHPDRTELITTLAHEGYPGHLYQNSFEHFDSSDLIRNLIYIGGYTEGWGLYSELYAYDFLGLSKLEAEFLRALSSLNFAICANLDLYIHAEGWSEKDCASYLTAFGITDSEQIHNLYLNILEEPSNYLKYYLGYLEICRLKEYTLQFLPNQSPYTFHSWFLKTGPAPFEILEEHINTLINVYKKQMTEDELEQVSLLPIAYMNTSRLIPHCLQRGYYLQNFYLTNRIYLLIISE